MEGNTAQADEYWRKAQAILKEEDVDEESHLKFTYEEFQFPRFLMLTISARKISISRCTRLPC